MLSPDGLLGGLRGRRLCWELIGLACFDLGGIPRARVREQVSRTVDELRGNDARAGLRILQALRASVDAAMYWQEPDECDYQLRDRSLAELLRPVADQVASCREAAWWSDSVLVEDQHYVQLLDDDDVIGTPVFTGARQALVGWRGGVEEANAGMRELRITNPELYSPERGWANVSGCWWSAPIQSPIRSTTRAIPQFGPAGLWLVEDSPSFHRAVSWPVRPKLTPRIAEITGPEDWIDLVHRHPVDVSDGRGPDWQHVTGRRGRWLIPNWRSVAEEFDAVHLTTGCYLTTAGQVIDIAAGAASMIAGWAPDNTYWLSDALEITGPATHWTSDADPEYAWRVIADQERPDGV